MDYKIRAAIEARTSQDQGIKTSRDLSLFFPPEEFFRNEMINMIRQGDNCFK